MTDQEKPNNHLCG